VASAQGRSFLTVQMQERSDERRYFLSDLLVDLASISHLRLDDENASRCWLETRTGKFAFAPLSSTSVNAGRVRRRTLVCSALPYYRREREREEEGRLGGRAVSVRLPAHDATYPLFFFCSTRDTSSPLVARDAPFMTSNGRTAGGACTGTACDATRWHSLIQLPPRHGPSTAAWH
jgi:hypothetical protein